MKILRFNDDRVGVIKNNEMVVDVSESISSRRAKGGQRVMEEIIAGWRKYRRRFDKILAEQNGVPLSSVQLLCPLPRPGKCIAAFSNYIDRPGRTADNFPHEYFYKSPDLVGPGGAVELRDIPACVVYQPEAEFAYVIGKTAKIVTEPKALDFVFGYVPSSISPPADSCAAHTSSARAKVHTAAAGLGYSPKTRFPIRTMSL